MTILIVMMLPVMDDAAFRHAQHHNPQRAAIVVVVMSAAEPIQVQPSRLTAAAALPQLIDFAALLTARGGVLP